MGGTSSVPSIPSSGGAPGMGVGQHHSLPGPLQLPVTLRQACVAGATCPGPAWEGTAGTGAVDPHPPGTPSPPWTTPWELTQVGLGQGGAPELHTHQGACHTPTRASSPAQPGSLRVRGLWPGVSSRRSLGPPFSLVPRPLCRLRNRSAGSGGPGSLAAQPAPAPHPGLLPPLLVPHGLP